MQPLPQPEALHEARRQFFHHRRVPADLVATTIARSWERCARLGLSNEKTPRLEPLAPRALQEVLERRERLRRLARPEIEALRADASATESVVILADESGLILESCGDDGFAARAARVALRPGVNWSENSSGTNAIGTAITERRSVAVHGAEHFFDAQGVLTCAAAPILDPRGELVGVLDVSGHASVPHGHALGLVRLAADQIEHRFFQAGFERCDVFRFHADPALLGTPREGVVVFDGERLIAANRHALALLGLRWPVLNTRRFAEMFADAMPAPGDAIRLRTHEGVEFHGLRREPRSVPKPLSKSKPSPLPGTDEPRPFFDAPTLAALARAERLVNAGVPVLVHGETGTGKEVFAREVHARSERRTQPFVAVNCAALPETLIESELFGYEEGAYTGARRHGSKGLVREADGGILFLDEIGDMPLGLQARLLRVLQEREVRPLGGGRPVPVNFWLIGATHRDLRALVEAGAFRADLYFRIAQYTIALAPLRAMPDIGALVREVWQRLGAADVSLRPETVRALAEHAWPGNFRQLASTLRALRALAEPGAALGLDALPTDIREPSVASDNVAAASTATAANGRLEEIAREAMQAALESCGGNVSRAARKLGVDRSTLYRRLLRRDSACR